MKIYTRMFGLIGCLFAACGGSADLASNSETHFLGYCEDDEACEDGLSCMCGVCTSACDSIAACGELTEDAVCRKFAAADELTCGEHAETSVCDVACGKNVDCAPLGEAYQCVSGFCRPPGCVYQGKPYAIGATFPALGGEACNTCSCGDDGAVICTRSACPATVCDYAGKSYRAGESFPATDGCNSCLCEDDGTISCSERACATGGTGGTGGTTGSGGSAGSAGAVSDCFSPTQNLETAYDGGTGCPCTDADHTRCIDGAALICAEGRWKAVEDGPCLPSTCNQPLQIDHTCDATDRLGYWHNAATGQCEPFFGGCPENDNAFMSQDECVDSCQDKLTVSAVVPWGSCDGLGEQISQAGDEASFTRDGNIVATDLSWGCGCPTRPEFVLAYEPESPLILRLCADPDADLCEAFCSESVRFDLSQAFEAAQTDDFVFVDP